MNGKPVTNVTDPFQQYRGLIGSIVFSHLGRCRQYCIDPEDLVQVALMEMWRAMKRIAMDDPLFVPYVAKAMRRGIANYIFQFSTGMPETSRRRHGVRRYPNSTMLGSPTGTLGDDAYIEDFSNVIVVDFISKLPKLDATIIEQRMAGYHDTEIQKMNGLSERNLRTRGKHIRAAYRVYQQDIT